MVSIKHIDLVQQRVVFNLDPGNETIITLQELGSLIKQELKLAPLADDSDIFEWTGFETLPGGNKIGIVMTMRPGWTIWTEDAGSRHRFRITQGIILGTGGADPLGSPINIIWSLAEYTVSSTLGQTATDLSNIAADVATLVADMATVKTDQLKMKRYLGIGVKRSFVGGKLEITDEGKTNVVQRFTIDDVNAPTSQVDDDI